MHQGSAFTGKKEIRNINETTHGNDYDDRIYAKTRLVYGRKFQYPAVYGRA